MLELEEFARLQSAMERASSTEAVLRSRSITTEQWLEAERRWLEAFAKEIEEGSSVLAERYLAAFLSEAPKEPVAAPVAEAPVQPARPVHVPSYMRMGGGMSLGSPLQSAPPQAPPPAAPPIAPQAPAPAVPPPAAPPHVASPQAASPAAVPPKAARPSPAQTIEHSTPKRSPPTLPFQTPKQPEPSSGHTSRRRRNVELPAHIAALKGTPVQAGGTVEIDNERARRSEPPLPFKARAEAQVAERKRLNVDQFAWIVATVETTPKASVAEVLGRMRMTQEHYATMSAEWQADMARDPALAAAFAAALAAQHAKRRGTP